MRPRGREGREQRRHEPKRRREEGGMGVECGGLSEESLEKGECVTCKRRLIDGRVGFEKIKTKIIRRGCIDYFKATAIVAKRLYDTTSQGWPFAPLALASSFPPKHHVRSPFGSFPASVPSSFCRRFLKLFSRQTLFAPHFSPPHPTTAH